MKCSNNRVFSRMQWKRWLLIASVAGIHVLSPSIAWAQANEPAQGPLVQWRFMPAPNIMLIFDTSLSMGKSYIPEHPLNTLSKSTYTSGNGARVVFHPEDYVSSRTNHNGFDGEAKRFVPTETDASKDPQAAAMAAVFRSPQHNLMYYNPATRYVPWLGADGKPMPNAIPEQVRLTVARPFIAGGYGNKVDGPTPTVDLTGKKIYYFSSEKPSASAPYPQNPYRVYMVWDKSLNKKLNNELKKGSYEVAPATYFIYRYGLSGALDKDNAFNLTNVRDNYLSVTVADIESINVSELYRKAGYNTSDPLADNFVKVDRPDCSRSGDDYICSQAQEYQNFANWYQYYRSRTLAGLGALTHAMFKDYGFSFRYGWADFNERSTHKIDGVKTGYIRSGVRYQSLAHNQSMLTWAAEVESDTNGTTPTRAALGAAGEYFSRTDDLGPWSDKPGIGTAPGTPQLACRRNFSIIVTDGRWNSTAAPGLDDGKLSLKDGPEITGPNGQKYHYTPKPPYAGNRRSTNQTLSDVALQYWSRDIRPDMAMPNTLEPMPDNPAFWQHMVTHVVAFGLYSEGVKYPDDLEALNKGPDAPGGMEWPRAWVADNLRSEEARTADMWHAAINGHGAFIPSSNPMELIASLQGVMEKLSIATVKSANITMESDLLVSGNRVYVPSYTTVAWTGDLVAHKLTMSGKAGETLWSAAERMPAYSERNIWVGTGGNGGGTAAEFKFASLPGDMQSALRSERVVNWLRGDPTFEDGIIFRQRQGTTLGDIINSNPVYSKENRSYGYGAAAIKGREGYSQYLASKAAAANPGMIFIGANDGMLHAFAADGAHAGSEVFAYIPHALRDKLDQLVRPDYKSTHLYYVDGPLSMADGYWEETPGDCSAANTQKDCWHSVLLGSTGAGAKAIFALDITDPQSYAKTGTNTPSAASVNKTVLWEVTPADSGMSDMGFVMQRIQAGYILTSSTDEDGRWVAVFGNGPYSQSGKAVLYVVDLKTGEHIADIPVGAAGGNGLMGVTLIRGSGHRIVGAYAGDLKGNLWKFDLSSTQAQTWAAKRVFTTIGNRAITQAPQFTAHPLGGKMVLFGTGKFFDLADTGDHGTDTFYGIWDKNGSEVNPGTLLQRTVVEHTVGGKKLYALSNASTVINWSAHKGWYLNLDMGKNKLRSLYSPSIIGTNVAFKASVTSDKSGVESCEVRSFGGINFVLNLFSGGNSNIRWDINNDHLINEKDGIYVGIESDEYGPGHTLTLPNLGAGEDGSVPDCPPGTILVNHDGNNGCAMSRTVTTRTQLY